MATTYPVIQTKNGLVGVNEKSPSYELDVNGQANVSNYINVGASTGITSSGWIHLHRYSSNLNVSVGNNGTNIDLLVPNGQLAVGTTDPSSFTARVSGTMQVTSTLYAPQIAETTGGQGVVLGNFTGNDSDEWPKIFWYRDTANGWDEGLIKGASNRGVFGVPHFGIHFDDSKSFAFHTSSFDTEMEIKGTGLIYMKGQLMVGRTSEVANVKLAVENAAWFDSNSASRVLYLEAGAENGNIIQFQKGGVNKWELVGRDGTFYIYKNDGTGAGYKYQISSTGAHTLTGNVLVTGTLSSNGDVIAYASSDKRLKDNITPISNALDKVNSIGGYEFDWNNKQETYEGHDVGIIAQEVENVLPEVVTTREDGYKAVKYEKIVPLLIEAIKEQQKQINELKDIINNK
jgi:hypothetical protein